MLCQSARRILPPLKYSGRILRKFSCEDSKGKGAACKACIVTGGSAGIGLEFVRSLVEAGAKGVVIGDIDEQKGRQAVCALNKDLCGDKPRVFFQKCDVTNRKEFECLFEYTKTKYKYIDVVVNNAGILQFSNWEKEITINVYGMVLGTLLGFKYMGVNTCGNGGAIVNCASILGLQPFHGSPVYTGSKHFMIGFTRSMGSKYFEKLTRVKVYAICPGVTDTNMIEDSDKYGISDFGDIGQVLKNGLNSLPSQPASACGKCLIKILDKGKNGSAWVIEDSECYRVKFPDRHTMRICEEE